MASSDSQNRSPRAETARNWFWGAFGLATVINAFLVQTWGLDFLDHGWWLFPRYVLFVITVTAGAVWGWETYQRRKRRKETEPGGR